MVLEFRHMSTEEEFQEWAVPYVNAYPAIQDPPDVYGRRFFAMSQDPALRFLSVREDGRLVGGLETLDLEMNYLGTFIKVAGVGQVWVDFLQKKRGIAKAIVEYFLDHCESTGACLALLYAFRPDFYHDMGFGYGPRQEHYSFRPASLPEGTTHTPHGMVYLTEEDALLVEACRNEVAARRHGQTKMYAAERVGTFRAFGPKRRVVGYKENGRLRGYMTYGFRRYEENFIKNDMVIYGWLWDSPETLMRFCAFLRSQADQVRRTGACQ